MDRRFAVAVVIAAASLFTASRGSGQQRTLEPDLAKLADGKGLEVFNRSVSSFKDGTKTGLRLSEGAGNGVAYLQGIELGNGTIELDIRGKDVQQQSFVGVAFHGGDDTTYDAVYFRPFNFKTDDQARRKRAVQYVSHPTCPWQKLRAEHPGEYEQPVSPAPDPNARSEEHTSELQSLAYLVCRLLLEKKKKNRTRSSAYTRTGQLREAITL